MSVNDGLDMGGFYVVVKLAHGGSATNRATPSSFLTKVTLDISYCPKEGVEAVCNKQVSQYDVIDCQEAG